VRLLRSTRFVKGGKRPPNYPEEFFNRVPINKECIELITSKLIDDDVYLASRIFSREEHKSASMASQVAALYVILYFQPDILNAEAAKMRAIVDKVGGLML
jgi:WASH complex subunit strumpellin